MNKIYQKVCPAAKTFANPQLGALTQAVIAGMDRQSRNEKDLYEQTGSRVHAQDDGQRRKGFTLIELLINKGHSGRLLSGISRFLNCCLCFINNRKAGDPRQKHSGMTALKALRMTALKALKMTALKPLRMTALKSLKMTISHGFTLIELLVVVLIIGILAAIALPKYQAVVGKVRLTEAIVQAKALYDAQQRCKMANGKYCEHFADLDVQLPAGEISPYGASDGEQLKANKFTCMLLTDQNSVMCQPKLAEYYNTAAYKIYLDSNLRLCVAWDDNFTNQICQSLGGVFYYSGWNTSAQDSRYTYYRMP